MAFTESKLIYQPGNDGLGLPINGIFCVEFAGKEVPAAPSTKRDAQAFFAHFPGAFGQFLLLIFA